ncbi:MAG: hypothetical protein J6M62_09510 [Selenomonadaceae bacterium]|nr:hypothetical protein [Selenomonadaceae bacterium]MBP3722783.1 hypothetical protein [Selenomonadaceae bacterium]
MQKIGNFGAKALFFLLPFMGLLFTRLKFDSDFWFILNSGKFVAENGFPYTEPFTMHEGLNFVLEQWATDIIYWEIFHYFGAEGVIAFVIIIGFFIIFIYEKICLFLSDNVALSKILTLFFGVLIASPFLVTRPQIFSALIFLAEVFLLLKYAKTNENKYLFLIPIFSLLMINLHAALWPMIFVLMLPFTATFFARILTKLDKEYLGEKFDIMPIVFTATISFFVGFLNPYGFNAMAFLFTSYDPAVHGIISEVQPMTLKFDFSSLFFVYSLFFFVFLFSGVVLISRKKTPLYLILLFAGLGFLAMLAIRNVFLFYSLGTFVFAYNLRNYEFKLAKLNWTFLHLLPFIVIDLFVIYQIIQKDSIFPLPAIHIIYLIFLFVSLTVFAVCYGKNDGLKRIKWLLVLLLPYVLIASMNFQNRTSEKDYIGEKYKECIDVLLGENDAKDLIFFTGFNTGAYAEYRGIKCYMDARPEIFAPKNSGKDFSIIGEYIDVINGKIYYRDFVEKYNFNYMLVEEGDGVLFAMLPHDKDFVLLHEEKDDAGKVYARLYKVNINIK